MNEIRGLVDKSAWGPGPWQDEPDRVEWIAFGFACLITRTEYPGNLCGYLAVPEGHPWFEKGYADIHAQVHGGVNYAAHCSGKVCHTPEPGMPDHVWWLGFDCGHGFDLMPAMVAELREHGFRSAPILESWEYRDLAYVRANVEALAMQASEAK